MLKLSAFDVKNIIKLAHNTLVSLQEELEEAQTKIAVFEKKERVLKIANIMEQKGLNNHLTLDGKIEALMEEEDLNTVEKAIGMASNPIALTNIEKQATKTAEAYLAMLQ